MLGQCALVSLVLEDVVLLVVLGGAVVAGPPRRRNKYSSVGVKNLLGNFGLL